MPRRKESRIPDAVLEDLEVLPPRLGTAPIPATSVNGRKSEICVFGGHMKMPG